MDVYFKRVFDHFWSIFIVFLFLDNIPICNANHICDGADENLLSNRLGTKTGYFAPADEKSDNSLNKAIENCEPVQIWFLARHGTRYPTHNDFKDLSETVRISREIVDNHHQGRGCLSEETIEALDHWFPPYSIRDVGQLQEMGYEELFNIGEHYKNSFPNLFDVPYNTEDYKVEFTVKNRTGQSAYHFLRGLFGDEAVGKIDLPKPHSPNYILKFYDACPRYIQDVENNNETYKEMLLFEKEAEFQTVVHALSARLGYMHPLEARDIKVIYDECRYEAAWWPDRKSPWCEPFGQYDTKVLEYHQDLKYYYRDSYGNDLNGKIACKTITDLYTQFKSTISSGISKPRAILYFSHAEALMKIFTALGLFKPSEHLKHSNFQDMDDRPFRTSTVSRFASNLGFVLYKCQTEYKVALYYDEQFISMKGLCEKEICKWKEIAAILSSISNSCDFTKYCMLHDEL